MMYVLIFILTFVYSQSLIYQMDAANQPNALNEDHWLMTGIQNGQTITLCNDVNIQGGQDAFTHETNISKVFFDLTPHFKMKIEINLLWFNLELAELKFENDNTEITFIFPATTVTRTCSETTPNQNQENKINFHISICYNFVYQMSNLVLEFPHQRKNYIFQLFQDSFSFPDATWGFDSFKVYVYSCPAECLQCSGEDNLNCYLWRKLQFSFIQCDLENSDIQQWGGEIVDNFDEFGFCKGIRSISLENFFILPPSDKVLIRFLINKNTDLTIWINENRIDIYT